MLVQVLAHAPREAVLGVPQGVVELHARIAAVAQSKSMLLCPHRSLG